MNLRDGAYRARTLLQRLTGRGAPPRSASEFVVPQSRAEEMSARAQGPLADIFFANNGRAVWKWVHYFDVYERYCQRWRGTDFRMLEIGIYKGGSLDMWRRYFGPEATIFGVDINPDFARNVDPPNQVRIGSQSDPEFLTRVVKEMGGVDVVLDDGSHAGDDQRASFQALFPLMNEGGLYIIEDLHTAYWRQFNGGYRRPISGIEFVKQLIDDMHHWYHDRPMVGAGADSIGAIHVHDSIVVIEKARVERPVSIEIGSDANRVIPGYEQPHQAGGAMAEGRGEAAEGAKP